MIRFLSLAMAWLAAAAAPAPRPVQVTLQDAKTRAVELALDPAERAVLQMNSGMAIMVRVDNQSMHLGQIVTTFRIDGQITFPARVNMQPVVLPKAPKGKARQGFMQEFDQGPIHITQRAEVAPSKPAKTQPDSKRRLDTVLVRYTIENRDKQPHQVGTRIYVNTMLGTSRTALFAAPNQPGKVLNGVELKDKQVPDYLQVLQNGNLENPGLIATMTYRFGRSWEAPNRVVLTRIGAPGDGWNFNALPAGNSAMAVYWDPVEIKPGGKRELAYAYGGGIASPPGGEGHVSLALGGSFEPGKLFTITAHVDDPAPGQSLSLELPDGIERVEGKERQPVPLAAEENASVVIWKARVPRMGDFRVRVRSGAGATLTKLISVRGAAD